MMKLDEILDVEKIITAKTRISQAEDKLELAEYCVKNHKYRDAASNMYYAIFNLCRAIINLDGFDTRSHHNLIGYFNYEYIHKREVFSDNSLASKIHALFNTRGQADYEMYFNGTEENMSEKLKEVKYIYSELMDYINSVIVKIKD